jgi:hypothetical protein
MESASSGLTQEYCPHPNPLPEFSLFEIDNIRWERGQESLRDKNDETTFLAYLAHDGNSTTTFNAPSTRSQNTSKASWISAKGNR